MVYVSICFIFMLNFQSLQASTVIPFENLGEMARNGSVVVLAQAIGKINFSDGQIKRERTEFIVGDRIHGNIADRFFVQNLEFTIGEWYRSVSGDVNFEVGSTYFMILEPTGERNIWKTKMLSYGVFLEENRKDQSLLVPVPESRGLEVIPIARSTHSEPMGVYWKSRLINQMEAYLSGNDEWNENNVLAPYNLSDFRGIEPREAPSHCSNLRSSSETPVRWNVFPDIQVEVYGHENGDSTVSAVNMLLSDAVANLNNNYSGINLGFSGTHDYFPDSSENSAYDNDSYLDYISINEILVQYNDPADEISDLNNCSGTLAIGGAYWSTTSTHAFQGENWYTIGAGFVVVNNDLGECQSSSDYISMLTHELTHALGIGHISGSEGAANMNPNCCNDISSLDIECLDYTYLESQALPFNLLSFTGEISHNVASLKWVTANEINTSHFDIEYSLDGNYFTKIHSVDSERNRNEHTYEYEDFLNYNGTHFYRLHQWDKDGKDSYSHTIQLTNNRNDEDVISIYPNPVVEKLHIGNFSQEEIQYTIINTLGQVVKSENLVNDHILLGELQSGVYFILFKVGRKDLLHRIIVQ